jgi:5-methylcytosine-specific restriction endonuclease McrA
MPTKIQNLRLRAFQQQQGRCWYCGVQMWHRDPAELPGIPAKNSSRLRCTAEHLQARCDGGRHEASNVVAACAYCNHTRHKIKPPPAPNTYFQRIRKKIAQGGWHPGWVRSLGLLSVSPMDGKRVRAFSSGR